MSFPKDELLKQTVQNFSTDPGKPIFINTSLLAFLLLFRKLLT